jgi:RNA polymerase sigma-70 factor (ECF subfamily)
VLKLIHTSGRAPVRGVDQIADDLAPLVREAREGSREAIRQLVTSVAPGILKAVRRVIGASDPEVDDVASEATYAFVSALSRFQNGSSTKHFAARIAVNCALNALRARRARPLTVGVDDVDAAAGSRMAPDPSPLRQIVAQRKRLILRDLLRTLPQLQAEALVLHLCLGHTVEEIASAAGVPANTVRGRLQSAKTALRQRVEQHPQLREILSEVES